MKLPSYIEIRAGLRRWRDAHGLTARDVAVASKERSQTPFRHGQVAKWETGSTGIDYRRLCEDILPAYGIEDFDTFIDYCQLPSMDDITVIEAADFARNPILHETICWFVRPNFLKNHRTRIDRVSFLPGKAKPTPWGAHYGHEFVLVLEGAVKCEFAMQPTGPRQTYTLTKGMAIAFHSQVFHCFYNDSETATAELVVAKPTHGGTADGKPRPPVVPIPR